MDAARSQFVDVDGVQLPAHLGDVALRHPQNKRSSIFYNANPLKWSDIPDTQRRDILLHQAIHIEGVQDPIPFVDGEWNRSALYNMNGRTDAISVHSTSIL